MMRLYSISPHHCHLHPSKTAIVLSFKKMGRLRGNSGLDLAWCASFSALIWTRRGSFWTVRCGGGRIFRLRNSRADKMVDRSTGRTVRFPGRRGSLGIRDRDVWDVTTTARRPRPRNARESQLTRSDGQAWIERVGYQMLYVVQPWR